VSKSRLLTDVEFAEESGLKLDFLRKDRRTRQIIPFYKIGGCIRYDADVAKVLEPLRKGGTRNESSK